MKTSKKRRTLSQVMVRIALSAAIIGAGVFAMTKFSSLKQPPHRGQVKEQVLQVEIEKAIPQRVQTRLKGFGVAQPVVRVKVSAEVAGRIVYVHPGFEKGRTILKGEVLFKIDPLDYQAAQTGLAASLAQKKSQLEGIQRQFEADQLRLKTIQRTLDLSRKEYDRVRVLLEKNAIGTRSEVERSEQAMNSAMDQFDQMKRSLSLYPLQLQEARAGIDSIKANLDNADVNLARCTTVAPFTCRITAIAMEKGEYATKGREVVSLADDSLLEILVSLDAREASQWMAFMEPDAQPLSGGFPVPRPVPCEIAWIEAKDAVWEGRVERLVEFDQSSRTMTLAVKFDPSPLHCKGCPPLVAGMFCSVSIPGKTLADLYPVKRWLVTPDNTLYIAQEGRLKTLAVSKVYASGDDLFVSGDIRPGDLLITTRLVDPLENSVVKIMNQE